MKRNAQKRWKKISTTERFNLYQSNKDQTHFEVSWKKSNGYGRRRFNADSIEKALELAPVVAGLVAKQATPESLRLIDAFAMVLNTTSRGKKSRHDWNYYVERFLKWLASHHPDCTHWHLLTREIIREYLGTYSGKSATVRRLALQPIIQTSGYVSREYCLPDIATHLNIGSKLQRTPPHVYLQDVVGFPDYLKANNQRLEAGAALQGLAGLQLQEATRLTWDRVDLEKGLIEISGEVKNEYRNRVIPVCSRVLDSLKRANSRRKSSSGSVRVINETVIIRSLGGPYGDWWGAYGKKVRTEILKMNPNLEWKAKDLRNCLPTFAAMQGLLNDVWEQYIGHAPRTITGRHYLPRLASGSLGEEDALDAQMNLFRFQVVEPVEKTISGQKSGKILNFFERQA